jgi:hypothetical protein
VVQPPYYLVRACVSAVAQFHRYPARCFALYFITVSAKVEGHSIFIRSVIITCPLRERESSYGTTLATGAVTYPYVVIDSLALFREAHFVLVSCVNK